MKRTVGILVGTMLAAAMPGAQAQSLHKCVARDGRASYQSQPCAAGMRTAWVREAPPEAPPSAERQARMRREQARRAVQSDYLASLAGRGRGPASGHAISTSRDAGACERARRRREDVLERVGLDRDFDLLRRLDDDVARACR